MTQLPHLTRGQVGPIKFHDVNEVFRHVERDAVEEVDEAIEDQEQRSSTFFIQAQGLQDHPTAPLGSVLSWIELSLRDSLLLGEADNGRNSTEGDPEDEFAKPAIILTPPFGIAHVTADEAGKDRYVFQPSPSVHVARVTRVRGGPLNASYDVTTLDGTIELSDRTPVNRWSGLDYQAASLDALVLLMMFLRETPLGMRRDPRFSQRITPVDAVLWVSERPEITDCNKGPLGFGDSFIGF